MPRRGAPALVLGALLVAAAPGTLHGAPAAAPTIASEVQRAAESATEQIRALPVERRAEALALVETSVRADAPRHPVLRLFNMTNWFELPWFLIGLAGQLAFFARMAVQWIVSERKRQSVVPPAFWWLSLAGSAFLVTYGIWRQDIVIILGQLLGVCIYTRNLWLIRQHVRGEVAPEPGADDEPAAVTTLAPEGAGTVAHARRSG